MAAAGVSACAGHHRIDATPGSVDGGGNRARGNAVAPQCENVFCSG